MKRRAVAFNRVLLLIVSLTGAGASAEAEPHAADVQPAEPWQSLVGEDLQHWQEPTGEWKNVGEARMSQQDPRKLVTRPGSGVLVNGDGRTVNLISEQAFGDIEAHVEFMVPRGSNSGVYFMGRYEVQILDSHGKDQVSYSDAGGIYQRWDPARGEGREGFEGHPPMKNAAKQPGQWQSFDVIFQAPRFDEQGEKVANARFVRVVHNGVVVHQDVEVTGATRAARFDDEKPSGPLMLQGDHGPVAYRNVRVRPLEKEPAGQ